MLAKRRPRAPQRGFTITELIAALAIAAVLGTVTVAAVRTLGDSRKLERGASNIMAAVRRARALGVTGRAQLVTVTPPPPSSGPILPTPPTVNLDPIANSGIDIPDATQLQVYSEDSANNRTVIQVVSLTQMFPESELRITFPTAPTQIVFRRDGTRDLSTPDRIVLEDMRSGRRLIIRVNGAGIPRLDS